MLPRRLLDRMARVQTMVDEAHWSVGWGLGLELYRRDMFGLTSAAERASIHAANRWDEGAGDE